MKITIKMSATVFYLFIIEILLHKYYIIKIITNTNADKNARSKDSSRTSEKGREREKERRSAASDQERLEDGVEGAQRRAVACPALPGAPASRAAPN